MYEEFCNGYNVGLDIKHKFEQSKLFILNSQAHFSSLSLPIYREELEFAFNILTEFKKCKPIKSYTFLLSKGAVIQYNHPSLDYEFTLELLNDFYFTEGESGREIAYPKCKVVLFKHKPINAPKWTDWLAINSTNALTSANINRLQKREDRLDQIIQKLKDQKTITNDQDFIDNTLIKESVWTLKDVCEKAMLDISCK